MRAFFSVDIEDERIQRAVREMQAALLKPEFDLKPVETVNLHLTLLFLGDIPERETDRICDAMKTKVMPGVTIMLRNLGFFPDARFARVAWIGVEDRDHLLEGYATVLRSLVSEVGIRPSAERFEPHLTILRIKSRRNKDDMIRLASSMSQADLGETRTSPVRFKMSLLTPAGPKYTTLCEALS